MSSDFTVVVATYGDKKWQRLAQRRAVPSAAAQAPVEYVHGESLHQARNEGLRRVHSEFVVFLDADDELAPGYIDAMAAADGDLRVPRLQWMRWRSTPFDVVLPIHRDRPGHVCNGACLQAGNFMPIGTAVRSLLAKHVGGFESWPYTEDRAFFARCWMAGARIGRVPGAVYRAGSSRRSRNRGHSDEYKQLWTERINAAVFGHASGL